MNIRTLYSKLHRKGLMGSLRLFTERYLYAHHQLNWFARELQGTLPSRPRRHAWEYVATRSDLLHAFGKNFPEQMGIMGDLLAQPDLHGYAALNPHGEVCAYVWVSPRDYHDTHYYRCWFPVSPGDAYLFALEIAGAHRGSALFLGGQDIIWQLLQQRGYRRAVAVVDSRNRIMLRLIERLGFRPDGRVVHVYTVLGWLRFTRQCDGGAVEEPIGPQGYAPADCLGSGFMALCEPSASAEGVSTRAIPGHTDCPSSCRC